MGLGLLRADVLMLARFAVRMRSQARQVTLDELAKDLLIFRDRIENEEADDIERLRCKVAITAYRAEVAQRQAEAHS